MQKTLNIQITESLKTITKNLYNMNESTKIIGEALKNKNENVTPQLAIENTQPIVQNTRDDTHSGLLHDPFSEHTLTAMKTARKFFWRKERPNGDRFWNGVPVEKVGHRNFQTGEDVYDISNDVQNVITDTTVKWIKKLNEVDKVKCHNFLKNLMYKDYEPTAGEAKSGRYL